jgi:hypothetical protein
MDKRLAVMQPYIFPYVGYLNLFQASSTFVFYDDVQFRKGSWINRNQIASKNEPILFTLPLIKASQNNLISEKETFRLDIFSKKFVRQLSNVYGNSQYFDRGMDYVNSVLDSGLSKISDLAIKSVTDFFSLLDIKKDIIVSSRDFYSSKDMGKSNRLIWLTKELGCDTYLNPISGAKLYSQNYFTQNGVFLKFVEPVVSKYNQFNTQQFIPNLSLIDLMMNLSDAEMMKQINSFRIL